MQGEGAVVGPCAGVRLVQTVSAGMAKTTWSRNLCPLLLWVAILLAGCAPPETPPTEISEVPDLLGFGVSYAMVVDLRANETTYVDGQKILDEEHLVGTVARVHREYPSMGALLISDPGVPADRTARAQLVLFRLAIPKIVHVSLGEMATFPPHDGPLIDPARKLARGPVWACPFPNETRELTIPETQVQFRVFLRPDGTTRGVQLLEDPGHGFGRVTAACAMKIRFTPAKGQQAPPVTRPMIFRYVQ